MQARNQIGLSADSATERIYAAEMPLAMVPPTIDSITVSGSSSSIDISWVAPTKIGGSAITGYYVAINDGYGTAITTPGTLLGSAVTTHTFSSLLEGVTYSMSIAAVNLIYASDKRGDVLNFSQPASQITAKVPAQITTFAQSTSNYEAGKINLEWTPPADNGSTITSYTLLRDVGSGTYYEIMSGLVTSYTDTDLSEGSSYNYKVYATNQAGSGTHSAILTAVAGELPG